MEQIFLKILNMSITASYCALAVMLLRLLFKKLPKIYSYALWLIVAFRLICPVSFESVFSLMRMPTEAISTNVAVQEIPEFSTENNKVSVNVNKPLVVATAPADEVKAPVTAEADVTPLQIAIFWGSILWLVVAAVFFGYGIGSYMRMRRELSDAIETEPGVFRSERLKTPFVLGHFKPQIYLPESLTSAEKVYVLEHERTHIRRGDHIIKLVAFFLMSVHWFNPILWVSFFMMCKDMEMSCDEKVVKKLSAGHTLETKKDYASTLLALASNHQFSFGGPISFGEGNIKNRINNVLQYKKRTVVVSVVLTIAVVVVALLFMGNPKEDAKLAYMLQNSNTPTATPTPTGGIMENVTPEPTKNPDVDAKEELPVAMPTFTPTPTLTPAPTVTPTPAASMTMRYIAERDNRKIYHSIIRSAVSETPYFSLEVPAECVNKVSYLAEVKKQEDGSEVLEAVHFYMTRNYEEQTSLINLARSGKFKESVYRLESYSWVELKDYLEAEDFGTFEVVKQDFVLINEAGTGGMLNSFPLDNTFSGEKAEDFRELSAMMSNESKITFHKLPQITYTKKELEKYSDWQQESLGTEMMENVYYGEIYRSQIITPYFELWVPPTCVDKVSYLLRLQEKEDGTKTVSDLQFFYKEATKPREVFLTEPKAWSDYFVTSSWLGGIGWATVEDYDVPDTVVVDWVNRTGSVSISKLESLYQAENAPFGREFVWVNAEETGAYFYYSPTDVQFESSFEEEYRNLENAMKNNSSNITFFGAPDAISRDVFIEKLKGVLAE